MSTIDAKMIVLSNIEELLSEIRDDDQPPSDSLDEGRRVYSKNCRHR